MVASRGRRLSKERRVPIEVKEDSDISTVIRIRAWLRLPQLKVPAHAVRSGPIFNDEYRSNISSVPKSGSSSSLCISTNVATIHFCAEEDTLSNVRAKSENKYHFLSRLK